MALSSGVLVKPEDGKAGETGMSFWKLDTRGLPKRPDTRGLPKRPPLPWSPLKRIGEFTLKEWASVAALLGALGFVVGRLWLSEFYSRLGLTPEEVGLDRAELLATILTAGLTIGVIFVLGIVVAISFWWLFYWPHRLLVKLFWSHRAEMEAELNKMPPGRQQNLARLLLSPLVHMQTAPLSLYKYTSVIGVIGVAATLVYLISILPRLAADEVLTGRERGWVERTLLPVQATCVEVRWLDSPKRTDSPIPSYGGSYIYMGEAGSYAVLVLPGKDESASAIRIPASMVTFESSSTTDCKP
jgi:hypothetical protein